MEQEIPDDRVLGLYVQDGVIYSVVRPFLRPGDQTIQVMVMSTTDRRPEWTEK